MSNHKGDLAEMDFKLRAMKKGLFVSSPENSQIPYDLLVDNKKQIFRVQVKSNFCSTDGKIIGFNLGCGSKNKKSYTDKKVDFIVCYAKVIDAWYIIPIESIPDQLKISIYPEAINSKWNKYRDAWDLLK